MGKFDLGKLERRAVNDATVIREQESKVAYAYSGLDAVFQNRVRILRRELDKIDITEEEKDEIIQISKKHIYNSDYGSDRDFELFVKVLCEDLVKTLERRRETDKIKLAYYDSLDKENDISLKLQLVILKQHMGARNSRLNGRKRVLYEELSAEESAELQQQCDELTRQLENQRVVTAGLLSIVNLNEHIKNAKAAGEPIGEYMEQIDQILADLDYKIQELDEVEIEGPSRKVA